MKLWLLCLTLLACNDPPVGPQPDPHPQVTAEASQDVDVRARQAAEISMRDVHFHGGGDPFFISWRGCSHNDTIMYEADGLGANGQRVQFVVCCGLVFRGCTVRIP